MGTMSSDSSLCDCAVAAKQEWKKEENLLGNDDQGLACCIQSGQTGGQSGYSEDVLQQSASQLHLQYTDKVQKLLQFGEYTLFRKWIVLVEGDFTCSSKQLTSRKRITLKDIRSIGLTKNWLIICQMRRLYQAVNDEVESVGVSLRLCRLVPTKFIRIFVSSPAQCIIGVQNQNGVTKEYQLISSKSMDQHFQAFATWRNAIGSLSPSHNDDSLYLTLKMFENWSAQHVCRITINPETQGAISSSGNRTASNSEGQATGYGNRNSSLFGNQENSHGNRNSSNLNNQAKSRGNRITIALLGQGTGYGNRTDINYERQATGYGNSNTFDPDNQVNSNGNKTSINPEGQETGHGKKTAIDPGSQATGHGNSLNKVNVKLSPLRLPEQPIAEEKTKIEDKSKVAEKPKSSETPKSAEKPKPTEKPKPAEKPITPEKIIPENKQPENTKQTTRRKKVKPKIVPSEEELPEPDFEIGCEISIGSSAAMTLSNTGDEVEGIETTFGPDQPMTPSPSDENMFGASGSREKKRKRSVREVFRSGLFVSKSKEKRRSQNPVPASGPSAALAEDARRPHRPLVQRRISRLEMNEPIEDIFNEVIFETMEKGSPTSDKSHANRNDDSDVIEDPDVVVMTSLLQKQCSTEKKQCDVEQKRDKDFLTFHGEGLQSEAQWSSIGNDKLS